MEYARWLSLKKNFALKLRISDSISFCNTLILNDEKKYILSILAFIKSQKHCLHQKFQERKTVTVDGTLMMDNLNGVHAFPSLFTILSLYIFRQRIHTFTGQKEQVSYHFTLSVSLFLKILYSCH